MTAPASIASRWGRLLLLAVWLPALAGPSAARAADLLAEVSARVAQAPVIRGQFEQLRRLAGFSNPLRSRGDFVVARGKGMVWATREPLVSTMVATPAALVVRGADGAVQQQLRADAQPGMRMMGDAMLALMRADFAPLAQTFAIDGAVTGRAGWQLTLVPRDARMRHAIARIELSGDRYLREIRVIEAGGDSTEVRLQAVQGADAPTPAEERAFD